MRLVGEINKVKEMIDEDMEVDSKKLGVIGFGNIGHRVALRAKAFEMDVIVTGNKIG